jgi:hypothetical protein
VGALSIRDSGRPLVELTCDKAEAVPSGAVKDEPADAPVGSHDEDYNFFHYYESSGHRQTP